MESMHLHDVKQKWLIMYLQYCSSKNKWKVFRQSATYFFNMLYLAFAILDWLIHRGGLHLFDTSYGYFSPFHLILLLWRNEITLIPSYQTVSYLTLKVRESIFKNTDASQVRTVWAANTKFSSNLAYAQLFFDILATLIRKKQKVPARVLSRRIKNIPYKTS